MKKNAFVLIFELIMIEIILIICYNQAYGQSAKSHIEQSPNSILVGKYPTDIAIDPNTHKVYVINRDSNSIAVIDEIPYKVVANITHVGRYPVGIAIDPNTHKVYVANTGSNTVSV